MCVCVCVYSNVFCYNWSAFVMFSNVLQAYFKHYINLNTFKKKFSPEYNLLKLGEGCS